MFDYFIRYELDEEARHLEEKEKVIKMMLNYYPNHDDMLDILESYPEKFSQVETREILEEVGIL